MTYNAQLQRYEDAVIPEDSRFLPLALALASARFAELADVTTMSRHSSARSSARGTPESSGLVPARVKAEGAEGEGGGPEGRRGRHLALDDGDGDDRGRAEDGEAGGEEAEDRARR